MDGDTRICTAAAMALLESLEWHEALGVWVLRYSKESINAIIALAILAARLGHTEPDAEPGK